MIYIIFAGSQNQSSAMPDLFSGLSSSNGLTNQAPQNPNFSANRPSQQALLATNRANSIDRNVDPLSSLGLPQRPQSPIMGWGQNSGTAFSKNLPAPSPLGMNGESL